jgi:competence protein ComEC
MRLVYITLGWASGMVLAAQFPAVPLWVWLLAMGLLTTATVMLWRTPARMLCIALLALAVGGYRYGLVPDTSDIAQYNNIGGVTIEGIVESEPDIRDDRIQLRLRVETIFTQSQTFATSGLVLVNAPRIAQVAYGDRISATGELITPQEFDAFSYSDFLARSGVFSILTNALIEPVSSGEGSPFFVFLFDIKTQAQQHINQHLPEPAAGLLSGILLGNERGISPEVADAFSAVGASHVIAISGYNMAIISGVIMGLLNKSPIGRYKWLATTIGIVFLAIYTLLVGANAAVVRAAIMSSLLVIAPLLQRKTYVPASLAFVALLMSLQNPLVLWDISFQLSFFAVLGLALFVEPLSAPFAAILNGLFPRPIAQFLRNFLEEPLLVSLAAQILTLPLIILYFQRVSLASLIVNLLIVPLQAPLLLTGAIATILAFSAPVVAQLLFWMAGLLLIYTIDVVRIFARLPFADAAFYVDPRLIALFFTLIIGGAMLTATRPAWYVRLSRQIRHRFTLSLTLFAGVMLALLLFAGFQSRPDGQFHFWLLNMGHSNAILMQTPSGAHILVDGGRFPSRLLTAIGDTLPFNDREIELLIITQPDEFDVAALPALLDRYTVGAVLTNGQPNENATIAALETALAPYPVVNVTAGYTVTLADGVLIEILSPLQKPELGTSLNNGALIVRVTYGQVSFLLMGDASIEAQTALLEAGIAYPAASVMTLPQHGTTRSLSAEFLAAVQPQVILLQSDPANRRGDPDADVLAMLPDVPFFRTDTHGTLHLWSDGEAVWVQPER